jgi:hypothetical protein
VLGLLSAIEHNPMRMKTRTISDDVSLSRILETIGEELYRLRIEKGYSSHVDFAVDHNLPRIQYWRMEKGKANLTLKSLEKVTRAHNLSLEEFLGVILKNAVKKKQGL